MDNKENFRFTFTTQYQGSSALNSNVQASVGQFYASNGPAAATHQEAYNPQERPSKRPRRAQPFESSINTFRLGTPSASRSSAVASSPVKKRKAADLLPSQHQFSLQSLPAPQQAQNPAGDVSMLTFEDYRTSSFPASPAVQMRRNFASMSPSDSSIDHTSSSGSTRSFPRALSTPSMARSTSVESLGSLARGFSSFDISSPSFASPSPLLSPSNSLGLLSAPLESPCSPFSPSVSLIAEDEHSVPRTYRKRKDKASVIDEALRSLGDVSVSLTELFLTVLDPKNLHFECHRNRMLESRNHLRLESILNLLKDNDQTKDMFMKWMTPISKELVLSTIEKELDSAKPFLKLYSTEVTPEFTEDWDLSDLMAPVEKLTPTWTEILARAVYPTGQHPDESDDDRPDNHRDIGRQIITSQVLYKRSRACAHVAMGIGLLASAMGAPRQLIGIMHRAGLSVCYQSLGAATDILATNSVESAGEVAKGPHSCEYDNVNFSSSQFVEQTLSKTPRVKSGTLAVIYKLLNAKAEDMILENLLQHERSARPLRMHDLRPSSEASLAYHHQSTIHIIRVLVDYVKGFSDYGTRPELQFRARRPHPEGHKTEYFPLRLSTIEEATAKGNLLVHEDIYLHQLKMDPDDVGRLAIPTCNDQLTNSRIRSLKEARKLDVSPWERRSMFQIGKGPFHTCLNNVWSIRQHHYGKSAEEPGTLANLFCSLNKVRLGNEKPDYHSLKAALMQVLDGLLLRAWQAECGFATLDEFAKSEPTSERLLEIASRIERKYATATPNFPPVYKENSASPVRDPIFENSKRMIRDLMVTKELVAAIKDCDFGRMEDVLVDLAFIFRGAGSTNYANEILHLLHNLKIAWTPEFANIMRDNMIVNVSGLPGHGMGIDLNLEHLINYLKEMLESKGIYGAWERGGNISASVANLMTLKKRVTRSLHINYQGSTHTPVDTKPVVWRMAEKARELKLLEEVPGRKGTLRADLWAVGRKKIEAGLETFNKRLSNMQTGVPPEAEEDEVAPVDFADRVYSDVSELL
ncbi:hypothetical protein BKA70DRAFT_1560410 [Coprinopsis sp. MPI-PUGE-AT-0042]|nr:hypothetical protein BKA70DRAFT_1560410 [Coprinopsis sp. MPI-PUGE-AT-0042]